MFNNFLNIWDIPDPKTLKKYFISFGIFLQKFASVARIAASQIDFEIWPSDFIPAFWKLPKNLEMAIFQHFVWSRYQRENYHSYAEKSEIILNWWNYF